MEAVDPDPDDPWSAARFEEALAPFFEEYGRLVFTPEARNSRHTLLKSTGSRTWDVFQTLLDPEGDHLWALHGEVDLRHERERERRPPRRGARAREAERGRAAHRVAERDDRAVVARGARAAHAPLKRRAAVPARGRVSAVPTRPGGERARARARERDSEIAREREREQESARGAASARSARERRGVSPRRGARAP